MVNHTTSQEQVVRRICMRFGHVLGDLGGSFKKKTPMLHRILLRSRDHSLTELSEYS